VKTKFSIKSILAVSAVLLMSIWSSTAGAYTISSTSTTNCTYNPLTKTTSCSINATAVLSGLRNTAKTPTAYVVELGLISGTIFCTNPADNSVQANGVPFSEIPIPVSQGQTISPNQIQKNGHFLSDITFEDPELLAAVDPNGTLITCQNSNWNKRIVVTELKVFGQILTDTGGTATTCDLTSASLVIDDTCTPVDNLLNDCKLPEPYYSDPRQAIATVVPYSCTVKCHDADPNVCNFNTWNPL